MTKYEMKYAPPRKISALTMKKSVNKQTHTYSQSNTHTHKQTHMLINKLTHKQTETCTNKLTHKQTYPQTHKSLKAKNLPNSTKALRLENKNELNHVLKKWSLRFLIWFQRSSLTSEAKNEKSKAVQKESKS